jgi:hypothetical protein
MDTREAWAIVTRYQDERQIEGAVLSAWQRAAAVYMDRAIKSNLSEDELRSLLENSLDVISNFWCAACVFVDPKRKPSQVLWRHGNENSFKSDNFSYDDMKHVAAKYLNSPDIRTNYLDWALLDALVYMEYRSFWFALMANDFNGGSINWAFAFSGENEHTYYTLRAVFWLISKLIFFGSVYGALWLVNNGLEIYGYLLGTILTLMFFGSWISYPARRKAKKKNLAMLQSLGFLYQHISHPTISPKRLRELVAETTKDGVILDGAVFALVDLMIIRNENHFTRNEESELP